MSARREKLRVALVGPGRIAVAHLEAIAAADDAAQLVAVAGLEGDRNRTEELANRYGAERAVHDPQDITVADDIDAVVVTVPNHVHAQACIDLLGAGKHVLVEKPLATTLAAADQMIDAAERNGRILMAGQCRRYFDAARQAKQRVADLGRPLSLLHVLGVYAKGAETDWWRSSTDTGGLALELNGPHVIDTMLWLIDSRPSRVFADSRRLRDDWKGADETVVVVDFADGSMGTGHMSINARPGANERWVNGPSGGMKIADDRTLWVNGVPVVEQKPSPYIEGDISFERQFLEFVDAIQEGRRPLADAREVRPVTAVLEAAHRSQQIGGPVELDPDDLTPQS